MSQSTGGWSRSTISSSAKQSTLDFSRSKKKKEIEKKQEAIKQKNEARKQFDKTLRDFQYCVGNTCYDAVKQFCKTKKLDTPNTVELMKFIRYAKEKQLIPQNTQQKDAVDTLCQTYYDKVGAMVHKKKN